MPRQPRLDRPGLVHHVMARGIEGRDLFRDDDDREGFLKRLADGVSKPGGPQLYAWALMSNHFHLLLRGGGLIRSAGGTAAIMARSPEERDLWDERILGGGDFVETVLRDSDHCGDREKPSVDEILNDVAEKSGISREQILGASRSRNVSKARKSFFIAAHESAGATLSMLGRLTGRSHVAVKLAIEQVRAERGGKVGE